MPKRVKPGDTSLSHQMLNMQADAARSLNDRISGGAVRGNFSQQYSSGYQPSDPDIVFVRNDTGCDLNKFDSVGLDYLVNAEDTPIYGASRPNACRHAGRFAVLTGELKNGQVGRAVISGVTAMRAPQIGDPAAKLRNTLDAKLTVDAGFLGTASEMQRAHGLHKSALAGSAAVLYYDDIGSDYTDLAVSKLRNPSPELVEASRSRCLCADGSCTYKCNNNSGTYSWDLYRQDCERADIKFTQGGWQGTPTSDDHALHTSCSCKDTPDTSRTCDAASEGEFLTVPCEAPESIIQTIQFADTNSSCGQYCLWHGSSLVRGCDESCDNNCACISPSDLGSLITEPVNVGDEIPYLFRTPCLKINEGGVCVHQASSSGWTEVYNNCSAKCPCEEPSADASTFPGGYRYSQPCNRARCIPCSPSGACRWKYNTTTVQNGFFTQSYATWTFLESSCPSGCECAGEPPGYEGQIFSGQQQYDEDEVVTVACCKSPFGSPCDPTSTTTTTTTQPPTTQPPGDPCGCPSARQCEWTCKYGNVGTGLGWFNTYSSCCNRLPPLSCTCGRGFVQPYQCTSATLGHKAYSLCTPFSAPSSSFQTAAASPEQLIRPTTTTTTTTTTTARPTVSPSTTEEITAAYPIVNSSGTTLQPTCRVICIKAQPTISDSGTVYQSGYTGIEIGTADGLCSRYTNSACIIPVACNESTAGQVIEGVCRTVER